MIPFSAHNTASDPALNNRHRLKQYIRFMGWDWHKRHLDIGPKNYIGQKLLARGFTSGDLNKTCITNENQYEVITCFEVIQHIMNPLQLLERCYRLLDKGGKFYLATPKQWLIPWYHGQENFVEYKPKNMRKMLEHAGFKVLRMETHNPWPFRFMFYGVRPFFRYIFNRYVIFECER